MVPLLVTVPVEPDIFTPESMPDMTDEVPRFLTTPPDVRSTPEPNTELLAPVMVPSLVTVPAAPAT